MLCHVQSQLPIKITTNITQNSPFVVGPTRCREAEPGCAGATLGDEDECRETLATPNVEDGVGDPPIPSQIYPPMPVSVARVSVCVPSINSEAPFAMLYRVPDTVMGGPPGVKVSEDITYSVLEFGVMIALPTSIGGALSHVVRISVVVTVSVLIDLVGLRVTVLVFVTR